jgi:hypothetical protein
MAPMAFFATASGLMIEKVRSIAMGISSSDALGSERNCGARSLARRSLRAASLGTKTRKTLMKQSPTF